MLFRPKSRTTGRWDPKGKWPQVKRCSPQTHRGAPSSSDEHKHISCHAEKRGKRKAWVEGGQPGVSGLFSSDSAKRPASKLPHRPTFKSWNLTRSKAGQRDLCGGQGRQRGSRQPGQLTCTGRSTEKLGTCSLQHEKASNKEPGLRHTGVAANTAQLGHRCRPCRRHHDRHLALLHAVHWVHLYLHKGVFSCLGL